MRKTLQPRALRPPPQLLTSIPQIGGFNSIRSPATNGGSVNQTTNIAPLRGLGSGNVGSSPTLILMDGHRLAGSGVVQTIPDVDVVPPGVLQRVEVVPDSGSSIYGADAVGGVINFVTRSDFDGFEANLRQGFGDEYQSTDAYFTAGEKWSDGSAFISYNYSQHDAIYTGDRDYATSTVWDALLDDGVTPNPYYRLPTESCTDTLRAAIGENPGETTTSVFTISGSGVSPNPSAATPEQVRCEYGGNILYPQERRDSVFAGLSQDLTDDLSFNFRAWYMMRTDKADGGIEVLQSPVITAANNSFFQCAIAGCPADERQTVFYSPDGVSQFERNSRTVLETWGFSPSITYDLGADWQARAFFNYGISNTSYQNQVVDNVAITNNLANINFYDFASTDQAILSDIFDTYESGYGQDEIVNGRVVFDGPLFTLPGGEVRVAVGAEYLGEDFEASNSQFSNPNYGASSRAHAYFGEVNIPVVSSENNIPLIHSLSLSLSARRDSSSEFESVTTPRVGLSYDPVDWVSFRANWGKSFQAPSLADSSRAESSITDTGTGVLGGFGLTQVFTPVAGDQLLAIRGANALEPQEAETFSLGFDVRPPFIENLEVGVTWWNIDYTKEIGTVCVFCQNFWDSQAANPNPTLGDAIFYRRVPDSDPSQPFRGDYLTAAEIETFLSTNGVPQSVIDQTLALPNIDRVNLLLDFRQRNLAATALSGLDLHARYQTDMSFGTLFASVNGSYNISNRVNADGLGFAPNTAGTNAPRWALSATAGATVGENFRAQATLQHSASYSVSPTRFNDFQDEVDAFDVVNLYFEYDVNGAGLTQDLAVSLGINNAFDTEPPQLRGGPAFGGDDYAGSTLGRVVTLGLSKRF